MENNFNSASLPTPLIKSQDQGFVSSLSVMPAVEFESGLATCRELASALSCGLGIVALVGPSGSGKSFILKAFTRPNSSSAQRAAVRTIDQPLSEHITLDLIDDLDAAGLASLANAPRDAIRRVLVLLPEALNTFQIHFPAASVVHMRPLGPADLRILMDARRSMLGLPIGSITTRAALILERRCSGSPCEFDRLFLQSAFEARSSPRIAAEHVERAHNFLQSQTRKLSGTEAARQAVCIGNVLSDPEFAATFVAELPIKMAFAMSPAGEEFTSKPRNAVADALLLLDRHSVASQEAFATSYSAHLTSTGTLRPVSAWTLLTRPQTAEEVVRVSRARRKHCVRYGLKMAGPALLATALVAVPSVLNVRQVIHNSLESLSHLVATLDEPHLHSNASPLPPPTERNASESHEQFLADRAAESFQVARELQPELGGDTVGGGQHALTRRGQDPPEISALVLTPPSPATALQRAQAPPPEQDSVDLAESASKAILLASPSPSAPTGFAGPQSPSGSDKSPEPTIAARLEVIGSATTLAGVAPIEDGIRQQRMGRLAEGIRLLKLAKALLAIGQRADATEMLRNSAELGNLEAASVLDSFRPSSH